MDPLDVLQQHRSSPSSFASARITSRVELACIPSFPFADSNSSSYPPSQTTLFIFCFCNETFFVCLYLLAFWTSNLGLPSHLLSSTLLAPSLPYLVDYPKVIAAISCADSIIERTSLPGLVAAVTGPIMFMKQVINGVQFWKAAKIVSRVLFELGFRRLEWFERAWAR